MNKNIKTIAKVRESSNLNTIGVDDPVDQKKQKHINKPTSNVLTSNFAITLIALIITIIVLLILAGVTLNMVMGDRGLINKAQTAKDETNKNQATEKINLKITTAQMNSYAERKVMPTLQELANVLDNDKEIEYVHKLRGQYGTIADIDIGAATSIYTKLKEYPYEFEINSSLQLASIDGKEIAGNTGNNNLEECNIIIDSGGYISIIDIENVVSFAVVSNGKCIGATQDETYHIKLNAGEKASVYVIAIDNNAKLYKSNTVEYEQTRKYLYNNGIESVTFNLWKNENCDASKELGNYIYLKGYDNADNCTAGCYTYTSVFNTENYGAIIVNLNNLYSNTESFPYRIQILNSTRSSVIKEEIFYGEFEGTEKKEVTLDLSDIKNTDVTFRFLINTAPANLCDAANWSEANPYKGTATCNIEQVYLLK